MSSIVSKLFIFGFSFLMFGVAAVQIFLGYTLTGRTGHQKRISMTDDPAKFWAIVALPLIFGILAFALGVVSLIASRRKR